MQKSKFSRGLLDTTISMMMSNPEFKRTYLFYACVLGKCSITIDYTLPAPTGVSFNVDHYIMYVNPDKFDEYNSLGRLAIIKHEMLHIIHGHIGRKMNRVINIWRYATDCAINQLIDKNHLPKNGITPLTFINNGIDVDYDQTAEYYYDKIKDYDIGDDGGVMSTHNTWEESQGDENLQKDITKKIIEDAMTYTLKHAGSLPCDINDLIKLHARASEVNWRSVLRNIISNKKTNTRRTIMRRDRRMPGRKDVKGKTKDRTFDLLVVADVSGSMSDKALNDTIGEVRHICNCTDTTVNLIQIDTVAHAPQELTKNTKVFSREGRGGTDIFPAIAKANECKIPYDAIVVLTDGWLYSGEVQEFSNLNKKVIWLIEPTGSIVETMNSGKMQAFKLKNK